MEKIDPLVALRLREPNLPRRFRVPDGLTGAVLVGVPPTLLIAMAVWEGRHESIGGLSALWLSLLLMGVAPILYWLSRRKRARLVLATVRVLR